MSSQDFLARPVVEAKALRVNDFCRAFGLGRSTAYKLIAEGRLKSVTVGKRRLILKASADDLLRQGEG
jgi:excisionase family DNA binding protein